MSLPEDPLGAKGGDPRNGLLLFIKVLLLAPGGSTAVPVVLLVVVVVVALEAVELLPGGGGGGPFCAPRGGGAAGAPEETPASRELPAMPLLLEEEDPPAGGGASECPAADEDRCSGCCCCALGNPPLEVLLGSVLEFVLAILLLVLLTAAALIETPVAPSRLLLLIPPELGPAPLPTVAPVTLSVVRALASSAEVLVLYATLSDDDARVPPPRCLSASTIPGTTADGSLGSRNWGGGLDWISRYCAPPLALVLLALRVVVVLPPVCRKAPLDTGPDVVVMGMSSIMILLAFVLGPLLVLRSSRLVAGKASTGNSESACSWYACFAIVSSCVEPVILTSIVIICGVCPPVGCFVYPNRLAYQL